MSKIYFGLHNPYTGEVPEGRRVLQTTDSLMSLPFLREVPQSGGGFYKLPISIVIGIIHESQKDCKHNLSIARQVGLCYYI